MNWPVAKSPCIQLTVAQPPGLPALLYRKTIERNRPHGPLHWETEEWFYVCTVGEMPQTELNRIRT
jgi:hypothetical protein